MSEASAAYDVTFIWPTLSIFGHCPSKHLRPFPSTSSSSFSLHSHARCLSHALFFSLSSSIHSGLLYPTLLWSYLINLCGLKWYEMQASALRDEATQTYWRWCFERIDYGVTRGLSCLSSSLCLMLNEFSYVLIQSFDHMCFYFIEDALNVTVVLVSFVKRNGRPCVCECCLCKWNVSCYGSTCFSLQLCGVTKAMELSIWFDTEHIYTTPLLLIIVSLNAENNPTVLTGKSSLFQNSIFLPLNPEYHPIFHSRVSVLTPESQNTTKHKSRHWVNGVIEVKLLKKK